AQRLGQGHDLHLVDLPVAAHAAYSGAHVDRVVEVGVVGELVHANPAHGPTGGEAIANRRQLRALAQDHRVAVHAGLRGRDVGYGGLLDRDVAVAAVEPQLADVQRVGIRHR